ncbi:MAG TPA: hypothetical protein V6C57_03195 [Coleofasciculaceae cyanobacterium]
MRISQQCKLCISALNEAIGQRMERMLTLGLSLYLIDSAPDAAITEGELGRSLLMSAGEANVVWRQSPFWLELRHWI